MHGSCNCKNVTFTTTPLPKLVLNCHCQMCRKMNGAAFSTYAVFDDADFKLTGGKLTTVAVSASATKSFCSDCGTPIYNQNPKYQNLTIVHLGALDNADTLTPVIDTYCDSQLGWIAKLHTQKQLPQGIQ